MKNKLPHLIGTIFLPRSTILYTTDKNGVKDRYIEQRHSRNNQKTNGEEKHLNHN